jgi:hypothetical protein
VRRLKDIGNRNADACVECGTAYNQSEPWQAEWLTAEFGNDASQWPEPEECSQYGTGCICRDIGETCYSDFPVIVDIWLVISGLWMVYLTWLCVTFWRDSQAKRKKSAKLSSMEKIVMLCLIANGMRVVWYIVVIPGRNPSTVIGGKFLEPLLLKIPQLLWMGSYFYVSAPTTRSVRALSFLNLS